MTPLHGGQRALTALQGLLGVFPKIVESLTNLGISLWNPGAVVHPGVMYGRCCVDYWDGKPVAKKPLFVKVDEYTDAMLVGLLDEFKCKRQANEMFWNIARDMKSSASVKLLGRSIGVTSSCLAFELSTGRVTSASVVIE